MNAFKIKMLSVGIIVGLIGVGAYSVTSSPTNNYPEYNSSKSGGESGSDSMFNSLGGGCDDNSCSAGVGGHFDAYGAKKAFSTYSKQKQSQIDAPSVVVLTDIAGARAPMISPVPPTDSEDYVSADETKASYKHPAPLKSAVVKASDTVISICTSLGISADDISDLVYGSGINERRFGLSVGQRVDAKIGKDGTLNELKIHGVGATTYRSFYKKGGGYVFKNKSYPRTHKDIAKKFVLGGSFVDSAVKAGLTNDEAHLLMDKLGDRVNLKKMGAEAAVKVVISETIVNKIVESFTIDAVRLTYKKQDLSAFNFHGNLYDYSGESLSPSFLKHPLSGKVRVTSHFSLNRMHPILHYRRPHWGTDYGCPIGTPILAISDAVVVRSGKVRGFGNMVMLKHPHHIKTIAAHMIRVAKGIHVGMHVKKGDVIGYVGKTGLSTGPHLHFEMRINGKRVDSLKAKLPMGNSVARNNGFNKIKLKLKKELSNI